MTSCSSCSILSELLSECKYQLVEARLEAEAEGPPAPKPCINCSLYKSDIASCDATNRRLASELKSAQESLAAELLRAPKPCLNCATYESNLGDCHVTNRRLQVELANCRRLFKPCVVESEDQRLRGDRLQAELKSAVADSDERQGWADRLGGELEDCRRALKAASEKVEAYERKERHYGDPSPVSESRANLESELKATRHTLKYTVAESEEQRARGDRFQAELAALKISLVENNAWRNRDDRFKKLADALKKLVRDYADEPEERT